MENEDNAKNLENIAHFAAQSLAGQDWHRLSYLDKQLVSALEAGGYLSGSHNGFVGQVLK